MKIPLLWIGLTAIAAVALYFPYGVTGSSLLVIISFFAYAMLILKTMYSTYRTVNMASESEYVVDGIKNSKLSELWEEYEKLLVYDIDGQKKTNIPSSEVFSIQNIARNSKINLRFVDAASGTLVGLGLLGTFLGLTLGIRDFDTSNVQNIQSSIQSLLGGMATAFLTSLFGMGFSIIYMLVDKWLRNILLGSQIALSNRLDREFYIDDQQLLLNLLQPQLSYVNESGEKIPISLAIRDILKESEQQSKALKSFSTDLAMQLNDGFDEILSRQMQAKIIPLMENIDTSTKNLISHVDQMSDAVTAPATDLIGTVIDELKKSINSLIAEFRTNISSSASHELEQLVVSLSEATTSLGMFPKNMENVTSILQVTITEVKDAISQITNTSANANASAMKQMQEQITFATGAINNAMTEVKEIMTSLTQSSEKSGQEMITKLAAASEQMSTFLNGVMANVSDSVKSSMKSITDDISDKQTDLMALQESTMTETEKLLKQFDAGIERLEKTNEYIIGTMNTFQQAQGQITGSTAHLQSITSDMKTATELFHKAQNEYSGNMTELQRRTQQSIDSVVTLLNNSGQLSEDYVDKFETIKSGLTEIFAQIQKGLTEYSQTVQASTQKYLEQYSMNLTKTTDALAGTIQQQGEIAELFVDALDKHTRR